jgi:hypothetical protein
MAKASYPVGLMAKSELSFHRAENCFGLLIKLTSQETNPLEESHAFAQPVTAKMSFQVAQMVRLDSGILASKQKNSNQLKKCIKVQSLKSASSINRTRITALLPLSTVQ